MNRIKPDRRSIRFAGYDYTNPGAYFITLCTHNKFRLFGQVSKGEMVLNAAGRIAAQYWREIPTHFPHAALDEFIVMPDHMHGIVWITDPIYVGANNHSPPRFCTNHPSAGTSRTIGSIVRGYKIGVTKWFRTHRPNNDRLATQLLRPYHPHRCRFIPDTPIYYRQSSELS